MSVLFLQTNTLTGSPESALAILGAFIIFLAILAIAVYIYSALAYRAIARKTKTEPAWLAWIPIAQLFLIAKIARMHWWPALLTIITSLLALLVFVIDSPVTQIIFIVVLMIPFLIVFVYTIIWHWKIYERLGHHGWWAILILIPYAGFIIHLIFIGIAAWSDK